jgi:hypothetical protein
MELFEMGMLANHTFHERARRTNKFSAMSQVSYRLELELLDFIRHNTQMLFRFALVSRFRQKHSQMHIDKRVRIGISGIELRHHRHSRREGTKTQSTNKQQQQQQRSE